jgi:hypothetical protein
VWRAKEAKSAEREVRAKASCKSLTTVRREMANRKNWFDLSEDDYSELLRLARMYRREAIKCETSKSYLAGCVTVAAALEALLLAMIHIYGSEVEAAGLVVKTNKRRKPLLKWTLNEMIDVAAAMNWLPLTGKRGKGIGEYAHQVRQIRNLLHPARYLQDHSPSRITERYLKSCLEIVDLANDWLAGRVNESLRKTMEEEGWLQSRKEKKAEFIA